MVAVVEVVVFMVAVVMEVAAAVVVLVLISYDMLGDWRWSIFHC